MKREEVVATAQRRVREVIVVAWRSVRWVMKMVLLIINFLVVQKIGKHNIYP